MEKNENIEMITGDPKKAINKLSLPIIASMFLIFANSIIDSIWVAGLGAEPLAALGYTTPLFMIIVGFGNGLGAGGNSVISRFIGAENKSSANNAAIHNLILSLICYYNGTDARTYGSKQRNKLCYGLWIHHIFMYIRSFNASNCRRGI